MSTRNRTKEFRERCELKGTHRIVVLAANGATVSIWESTDYSVIYANTLRVFQRAADVLVDGGANRNTFPATWRHVFKAEGSPFWIWQIS